MFQPLTPGVDAADEPPHGRDTSHEPPAPRVLVATLGDVDLAIPAALIDAVVRPGPVTSVPGPAPWLLGVTAVRGRVLPVADLRRLAGLRPSDAAGDAAGTAGAWLVVIDDGRRAAALGGLQARRVVACAAALDDQPARASDGVGLPTCGVARLAPDGSRGADALPPTAPLLDVAALLDLVHEPTGAQP